MISHMQSLHAILPEKRQEGTISISTFVSEYKNIFFFFFLRISFVLQFGRKVYNGQQNTDSSETCTLLIL